MILFIYFCYSKKALKATNNSGLQAALDWLEVNGENEEMFKEQVDETSGKKTCLMCNACKKKFSTLEQAEVHAARTLHDDFSEAPYENVEDLTAEETTATEPIVMTEEQKAARLAELRAKLAIKKAEREKEGKEAEVLRKASAKELEQIRREMQAKEMKKLAEERRLEKIADKKRREEIKKQIEEDRINKKNQIEAEKAKAAMSVDNQNDEVVIAPVNQEPTKINSTSARIQIKLPAPSAPLKLTFDSPSTQTLKDLKDRIRAEYSAARPQMELMQTFPTRVFGAAEDECTLNELGLAPSASLILK